jgi:hypothetical protein
LSKNSRVRLPLGLSKYMVSIRASIWSYPPLSFLGFPHRQPARSDWSQGQRRRATQGWQAGYPGLEKIGEPAGQSLFARTAPGISAVAGASAIRGPRVEQLLDVPPSFATHQRFGSGC